MVAINPHINFNGNAEEAFHFYKSVFGGEFSKIVRFKEIAGPEYPIEEKELNKIMHIALPIGNSFLIANDVPECMGRVNENENRSKIAVSTDSLKEAHSIFEGLSTGGEIEVQNDDNNTTSFFAMFRDKFGIEWTISFENK